MAYETDAPTCRECGSIMARSGPTCRECGSIMARSGVTGLMRCGNCGHNDVPPICAKPSKPTHVGLCRDPACTSEHCIAERLEREHEAGKWAQIQHAAGVRPLRKVVSEEEANQICPDCDARLFDGFRDAIGRICHACYGRPRAVRDLLVGPPGAKHDAGKPRYSLLPWRALDEVVAVLEHGVAKYGEGNWRLVPDATRRYIDAALRHIRAVLSEVGEDRDPESGRHHLAHAVCSLLFVLELEVKS